MRFRVEGRQAVGRWLLAACLAGASGCMSFVHPIDPPEKHVVEASQALPDECRKHVYIFLVGGMDPCQWANLGGVREYLIALGYPKVYYGQLYHCFAFNSEIKKIHREDPRARFVLVGFSFGANVVRSFANSAQEEGILIDLLVYLGGNTIMNEPRSQPDNVLHIENILATGCIWNGDDLDRAETTHCTDVWHFGSPTHQKTRAMFERELPVVAARVPIIVPPVPPIPEDEVAPTPRPLSPRPPAALPPGMDFLQPIEQLPVPRPADTPMSGTGGFRGQAGQQLARPVWIRGNVAPGEQDHQVARPNQ